MAVHFGIRFEFDRKVFDNLVRSHIDKKNPGYICVVDGNNFSVAQRDKNHMDVLNHSITNDCDSTWLAKILNWIYGTNYTHLNGPDLFLQYLKIKDFKHYFLGSSHKVLEGLKNEMQKCNPSIKNMCFEELPFCKVEEFDYESIAKKINKEKPDLIWISLGAPKQEQFMYNLKPFLQQGVMLGVGAAFNFYCGLDDAPKRAPNWVRKIGMEWIYRIFAEPNKQIKRNLNFLASLPPAVIREIKEKNKSKVTINKNIHF